jgi:hypothetical protein
MAYATKYRCEFTDDLNLDWKIDIQTDPWTGAITTLQASGDAMHITWYGDDDIMNQNIMGSKMTLKIESVTDFMFMDLFGADNLSCKVIVYQGSTVYWNGYILADNYAEPYDAPAFTISLIATDGLGILKDFKFSELSYTGRETAAKIIWDILGKVKITTFTEFVNVYEESMLSTVDDSPLDQINIADDAFNPDVDCYTVLSELLKIFNSGIRQNQGVIEIFRFDELVQPTMYGRVFTSATAKTSTTKTPLQKIARTGDVSTFYDTRGGTLMIIPQNKLITVTQDYGYRDSWIRNWQMKESTYDAGAGLYDNWSAGAGWTHISYAGKKDGIGLQYQYTQPPAAGATVNVYQTFGAYAIAETKTFMFSYDYQFFNTATTAASGIEIYVRIKSDTSNHWLKLTDSTKTIAEWDTSANTVSWTENSIEPGLSGWQNISLKMTSIPKTGTYTVTFWGPYDIGADVLMGIKNVQFYASSDELDVKRYNYDDYKNKYSWWDRFAKGYSGIPSYEDYRKDLVVNYTDKDEFVSRDYTKTNTVTGGSTGLSCCLGDITDANIANIIEQFSGALSTYTISNQYRVDTITLINGGAGDSVDITCDGVTITGVLYTTNLPTTAANFVTNYAGSYIGGGVVVTSNNANIIFTSNVLGAEFTGATSILPDVGTLDGTVALTTASHVHVTAATSDWNTRTPGSESKELLSIVADNLAAQYARQKMFIDIPIRETGQTTFLSLNGNIQDSLNVNQLLTPVRTTALWTVYQCTLVANWPYMRYTTTSAAGAGSYIYLTSNISISGSLYRYINIRYKVISGAASDGEIFYTTGSHSYSDSYRKDFTLTADGEWHVLILDMSSLTAGGTDWTDNTITNIRFDLTDAHPVVIDLDWIGFPRKFAFSRAAFDVKNREWDLTLSELI